MPFILEDILLSQHFSLEALFSSYNGAATSHDAELVKTKDTFLPKPVRCLNNSGFVEEYALVHPEYSTKLCRIPTRK